MGNQSSELHNGVQADNVPSYPRYFDIGSEHVARPACVSQPRARLSHLPALHQMLPHHHDDASPKGLPSDDSPHNLRAFGQMPSLNLELPDAESPMCPAPVPDDSSPLRRYPKIFPISSYAVPDATVQRPTRHVKFASSPTHSVHRSEIGVQPYSEIYGMHPRAFDFDEFGNKIARTSMSSAFPFQHSRAMRPGRHNEVGDYPGGTRASCDGRAATGSGYDLYTTHAEWGDW